MVGSPILAIGVPAPLINGNRSRSCGKGCLPLLLFDLAELARLRLGMSLKNDLNLLDLLLLLVFLAHQSILFYLYVANIENHMSLSDLPQVPMKVLNLLTLLLHRFLLSNYRLLLRHKVLLQVLHFL